MWNCIVSQTDMAAIGVADLVAHFPIITFGLLITGIVTLCATWAEVLRARAIEARWTKDHAEAVREARLNR